ncbi:MAG TPA: hypothetical protein VF447_04910 [Terriglobales bacterium]
MPRISLAQIPTLPAKSAAERALAQIRYLICHASGVLHDDSQLLALQHRCERRMRALGIATLPEYQSFLTNNPAGNAELLGLIHEIALGQSGRSKQPRRHVNAPVTTPTVQTTSRGKE